MKKLILILAMLMVVMIGLNATHTYGTVTSKTVGGFAVYSGLTTNAIDSTYSYTYIISPTFTNGSVISNKNIMVVGTVTSSILIAGGNAQSSLYADLQASVDGTNFATISTYKAYASSAATAGTVITVPVSLATFAAPYYRVLWRGQSAAGVANTGKIYGAINTSIYISPNP